MVGFKSKAYDWLVLNSKQEGLRLVGFKYQKADDWLNSKFHCSYLESRGVPEKNVGSTGKKPGNDIPLTSSSGDVISDDVTSGDVISGDVTLLTNPPQILFQLC